MSDSEPRESWVETENTQQYTPDSDPDRDEAWVQTQNTQEYEHHDEQGFGISDL